MAIAIAGRPQKPRARLGLSPPKRPYRVGQKGTFERTVGPDSTQWVNSSNGGTYTSSSGLNLQVAISGGWYGASIGTNIGLVALTSAGSDTSHMVDCALNDPNSTYAYQFIITLDGTQWASSQAINAHIWFKDECIPVPKTGCP